MYSDVKNNRYFIMTNVSKRAKIIDTAKQHSRRVNEQPG